uniref:G-protein coupled receptors family 1 profile domain-containing protein n=1 Tax=Angiostrongylus cantonensis TaxID=6313 RepID=A0A0K0CX54_ANGCA
MAAYTASDDIHRQRYHYPVQRLNEPPEAARHSSLQNLHIRYRLLSMVIVNFSSALLLNGFGWILMDLMYLETPYIIYIRAQNNLQEGNLLTD